MAVLDDHESSPCAACWQRASSFCHALLDLGRSAEPRQPGRHHLRQTFGGAGPYDIVYLHDEKSEDAYILCYGWAARVAQLSDGRRQILSILLAGDLFSPRLIFAQALRFSVQALTAVRFSRINRADLKARLAANAGMLDAFAETCIAEAEAADRLLVDLGRRTAAERIAHLILSLTERIGRRTVIREQRYPFPIRQQDIADILGLTPAHVSRVITRLRRAKLIEVSGGSLRILDPRELERIGRPR